MRVDGPQSWLSTQRKGRCLPIFLLAVRKLRKEWASLVHMLTVHQRKHNINLPATALMKAIFCFIPAPWRYRLNVDRPCWWRSHQAYPAIIFVRYGLPFILCPIIEYLFSPSSILRILQPYNMHGISFYVLQTVSMFSITASLNWGLCRNV